MPTDKEKKISIDALRELLDYNPDTGILTWKPRDRKWFKSDRSFKRWNNRFACKAAGSLSADGYVNLGCSALWTYIMRAHRIAWALHHGAWPADGLEVDHINGVRSDNRGANLRAVEPKINKRNKAAYSNSKTGVVGLSVWRSSKSDLTKWHASAHSACGRQVSKTFPLTEAGKAAAIAWRKEQISKIGGYTDRHGR